MGEIVRVTAADGLALAVDDFTEYLQHEEHWDAEKERRLQQARAAAAEVAYPDFFPTWRPREWKVAPPVCAAPGCDNVLPPGTRSDALWCSVRCGENVRQRRYRARKRAERIEA